MTDTALAAASDDLSLEEDATPKNVTNPQIVTAMVATAQLLHQEQPNTTIPEVIFTTVKTFLTKLLPDATPDQRFEALFSYYVATHSGYMVTVDNAVHQNKPISQTIYYNNAALSLFDLYQSNPSNIWYRRLIQVTGSAIHKVIINLRSHDETVATKDLFSQISTIALITETLQDYTRRPVRQANLPYLVWVKLLLNEALYIGNLNDVLQKAEVRDIVAQITNKQKVITVPVTSQNRSD